MSAKAPLKNSENSYRLVIPMSGKRQEAYYKSVLYKEFGDDKFVTVFLEREYFQGISQKNIDAVLHHAQQLLFENKLYPYKKTLLDNRFDFSVEKRAAMTVMFTKAFSSLRRNHSSVRRDLKFILELNVNEASNLMSLDEAWELWKRNAPKASREYRLAALEDNMSPANSLWHYALREEFFPDRMTKGKIYEFESEMEVKEMDTCKFVSQGTEKDGSYGGYRSQGVFVLGLASKIEERLRQEYFSTEKSRAKKEVRDFFIEQALIRLGHISYRSLPYLESFCADDDAMMEFVSNADIVQLICLQNSESIPKKEERGKEFFQFVADYAMTREQMDYCLALQGYFSMSLPFDSGTGGFRYDFLNRLFGINLPEGHELRMVSSGNASVTNYVLSLLVNNFGVDDVVPLVQSCVDVSDKDRKTLPTVAQWERLVRAQSGQIGDLPLEMGIELVSRKKIA